MVVISVGERDGGGSGGWMTGCVSGRPMKTSTNDLFSGFEAKNS